MKRGGFYKFRLFLSQLSNILFSWIYFFISFFIIIGESTQKVFLFILKLILKVKLPVIRIPKIKIFQIKVVKIRFPKITFEKIHLPKIKISPPRFKINLPQLDFFSLKFRYFVLGSLTTLIMVSIYQSYFFIKSLPSPNNIGKINFPLSTHILDRNGQLLYEIYRNQNRTPVSLKNLPPYVAQATIAIEDKDFYKHRGVALFSGVLRAIKEAVIKKEIQGGSTITQQLVKSALLTPERTITRKIKEIILALWAERLFTKEQILEMYLNQVAYGGSSYGIQEAARTYFGKDAKDLKLEEAAMLAGLPQAPSLYSPYNNPIAALSRRNDVLKAMRDQNYINEATYQKAKKTPLNIVPLKTRILAPHFVFFVKSQLESLYGISKVETGGLKVTTSLDLNIQNEAEKILKEELEKIASLNVSNGAILITRPPTGEILAMVGSVDYFKAPFGAFNVTLALRQPGSSIKPIMYSLALQKGFTAASIIDDSPVVFNIPGSSPYKPVNYDGRFHGKIPLRFALANSYNVPAVKVLSQIGISDFINHARKMGITSWNDPSRYGLSLTLGGGEVTIVDMATAFGVFANGGYKVALNPIIKVEDSSGKVIKTLSPFKVRQLDPGIAYIISDILSDNFARQPAFGARSFLEIPGYKVAVKTGTTDDKRDNWTIGYTPDFLVVVWVGNNDNSPMHPYLTSGVTGAAPIWNRVMSYLLKNYSGSSSWFEKPDNVVEKVCYFGRVEYFIAGTEKTVSCRDHLFNQTPTPTSQ
ncbi:MAG: transglycosylase domain-containing protein [Microgenomates group bacterium]